MTSTSGLAPCDAETEKRAAWIAALRLTPTERARVEACEDCYRWGCEWCVADYDDNPGRIARDAQYQAERDEDDRYFAAAHTHRAGADMNPVQYTAQYIDAALTLRTGDSLRTCFGKCLAVSGLVALIYVVLTLAFVLVFVVVPGWFS